MEQSVCLDDDDDIISDIVNTAHLNIDQDSVSAAMIHSPTTDTLDSVMLEPSDGSETQDGDLEQSDPPSPIPDESEFRDLEEKERDGGAEVENEEKDAAATALESESSKAEEEDKIMAAATEITEASLPPTTAEMESEIKSIEATSLSASPQSSPTEAVLEDEPCEAVSEMEDAVMEPTKESLTEDNMVTNCTNITITTTTDELSSLIAETFEESSPEVVTCDDQQATVPCPTDEMAKEDEVNDNKPSISSYFTSSSMGECQANDFFDNLVVDMEPAAEEQNTENSEEVFQIHSTDMPPTSPRNLSQVHVEPESVTFEGTIPAPGEENQVQEKEDFLLDGEEFESFTAEESQSGFELGLTGSPKQVFNESYTHSTTDHTTHERERHVSSSSKTSPSTGIAKDSGLSVFSSESTGEESKDNWSVCASSSTESAMKSVTESMVSASVTSSHSTPVHQPLRAMSASTTATLPPTSGITTVPFQQFNEMPGTEDLFTIGLHMSDEDRRHDAWIPSEETKNVLSEISSGQSVNTDYSSEILATPGITVEETQPDPIQEMLRKFMGDDEADHRQTMSADSVSQDVDGLCKLVKNECFRAAVELTGRLLMTAQQGPENIGQMTQHSSHTLQLWFCRVALLFKLRLYTVAHSELQSFKNLDTPDVYYEYYPNIYPGRKGSMVPFGLRLLDAQLPYYLGHNKDALDKLYYILSVVRQILANVENGLAEDGMPMELGTEAKKSSLELWANRECQVMYIIANILLSIKDYEACLNVYQELLKKDVNSQGALLTGIGRIFLQMGDINTAEDYFNKSEQLLPPGSKVTASKIALNKGLVALCTSNFLEAFQHFKSAVIQDPSNPVAVNNMAVSSLYLGKLKDALDTLEHLVHRDPSHNLHEGILFNLCTLYELESSHAPQKKQALLSLVSKHKGDSFHVACLKMA